MLRYSVKGEGVPLRVLCVAQHYCISCIFFFFFFGWAAVIPRF